MAAYTFNGNGYNIIKHTTFEHDIRVQSFIRKNDLESIYVDTKDMSPSEVASALISRLLDPATGCLGLTLISYGLIPAGTPDISWSESIGQQIVSDLKMTSDAQGKAAINELLVSVLLNFFQSGLVSLKTSH